MIRCISVLLCAVFSVVLASCQTSAQYTIPSQLNQKLSIDPGLLQGTFDNGFRYWIRSTNASGSNHTIHLRLILGVGSVDEDDNERGYTHLLEHLVFRSVEEDARLEGLIAEAGLSWGADVNAYTYRDHTEYRLSFSGEQIELVPRALVFFAKLLDDVQITEQHIRAEKPIVEAEWRFRQDTNPESADEYRRALLGNTRWLKRPPQGHLQDLRLAKSADLQRYWYEHYQPENAALIVTGKVDPFFLRQQIIEQFDGLANRTEGFDRSAVLTDKPVRSPLDVVTMVDQDTVEPYVRSHFFLPSLAVIDNKSFKAKVLDEISIEIIRKIAARAVFNHSQCTGFSADVIVSPQHGRTVFFEVVPDRVQHLQTCAKLLRGVYAGIPQRLAKSNFLRGVRSSAEEQVRTDYRELLSQTPWEMVEGLSDMLLNGDVPVSPSRVNREYSVVLGTISNADVRTRVQQILSDPGLFAVGVPPYLSRKLPKSGPLLRALESEPAVSKQSESIRSSDDGYTAVAPSASILSELSNTDWSEWMLSNGVRVVHYPSTEHDDVVGVHYIDEGGYASLPDAIVDEGRYLDDYHAAVALGGLDFGEIQDSLDSNDVYIETSVSHNRHEVKGVAAKSDANELFRLVAGTFQPLRVTAKSNSHVARTRYWQKSHSHSKRTAVWRQYWSRLTTGAPDVLTKGQSKNLHISGYKKAHELLYQSARAAVVVIYGDISTAKVKALLVDTFGAISKIKEAKSAVSYHRNSGRRSSGAATGQPVVVGGRTDVGALADTAETYVFHHCSDRTIPYPLFIQSHAILSRVVESRVSARLREDLGLTYAPDVRVSQSGKSEQVARYYIEVTSAQKDEAEVQSEINEILQSVGSRGVSKGEVDVAIVALDARKQLQGKSAYRRTSQIARGLYYGAQPAEAIRIDIDFGSEPVVQMVSRVAKSCFGDSDNHWLTVVHRAGS